MAPSRTRGQDKRDGTNNLMFRLHKTKEVLAYKEVRLQLIYGKIRQAIFLKLVKY